MVIRAHECPGVITVDLNRTQEVAGSIPASSTPQVFASAFAVCKGWGQKESGRLAGLSGGARRGGVALVVRFVGC